KDRLYCASPTSREYFSVRTSLAYIVQVLLRLWAPLLPFTCEEAWGHLPRGLQRETSVHLAEWPGAFQQPSVPMEVIEELRRVRDALQRQADPLRKSGELGSNQEIA